MEVARTGQAQPLPQSLRHGPSRAGQAKGEGTPAKVEATPASEQAREALAPKGALAVVAEAKQQEAEERQALSEDVLQTVKDLNAKFSSRKDPQIKFTVDAESGDVLVVIVDKETDEVIRQIPPKELVALRDRIAETRGVLFEARG